MIECEVYNNYKKFEEEQRIELYREIQNLCLISLPENTVYIRIYNYFIKDFENILTKHLNQFIQIVIIKGHNIEVICNNIFINEASICLLNKYLQYETNSSYISEKEIKELWGVNNIYYLYGL